ncbi:uncharacterized protein LOC110738317 [Chenopodium quinoa]|uniref:uncharacterized protein LOC110738317 n=1 Tax=Chenopodium quinoa TaxID=63459 RepID=UPI000B786135|nr:uncharacterized protein LOC110738317 [Chenopodium quinoa]
MEIRCEIRVYELGVVFGKKGKSKGLGEIMAGEIGEGGRNRKGEGKGVLGVEAGNRKRMGKGVLGGVARIEKGGKGWEAAGAPVGSGLGGKGFGGEVAGMGWLVAAGGLCGCRCQNVGVSDVEGLRCFRGGSKWLG